MGAARRRLKALNDTVFTPIMGQNWHMEFKFGMHALTGGSSGPFFFGGGGGGKFWRRGPNLPPFSSFSKDSGRFILKLLHLDTCFLFYVKFLNLFSRFGEGQTGHFRSGGGGGGHGPKCPPWIRQCMHFVLGSFSFLLLKIHIILNFTEFTEIYRKWSFFFLILWWKRKQDIALPCCK